jgi:hypothetical protein
MEAAVGEAQKVVKKQKVCEAKVAKNLQELIDLVNEARRSMGNPSNQPEQVLQELGRRIEEVGPLQSAVAQTKELHAGVGKLGKVRGGGSAHACGEPYSRAHACVHGTLTRARMGRTPGAGQGHGHAAGRVQGHAGRAHGRRAAQPGRPGAGPGD